ncbi:MAG: hypothetical protein K2K17_06845 [Lachnospiraceae bacterium]|nr:hypothetical protein [Lachnospiraceae bacterium]
MFVEKVSQVCTCFQLPPNGRFTVGRQYSYEYLIDAERVIDDSGEMITFSENMFQSCFEHFEEVVTSYSPMLEDRTTYCVYLVIGGLPPALEEIKAYVKTMQVNYLQAKKALVQGRNLIFSGNAYHTGAILKKLSDFQVHYEIEPTYPYDF